MKELADDSCRACREVEGASSIPLQVVAGQPLSGAAPAPAPAVCHYSRVHYKRSATIEFKSDLISIQVVAYPVGPEAPEPWTALRAEEPFENLRGQTIGPLDQRLYTAVRTPLHVCRAYGGHPQLSSRNRTMLVEPPRRTAIASLGELTALSKCKSERMFRSRVPHPHPG